MCTYTGWDHKWDLLVIELVHVIWVTPIFGGGGVFASKRQRLDQSLGRWKTRQKHLILLSNITNVYKPKLVMFKPHHMFIKLPLALLAATPPSSPAPHLANGAMPSQSNVNSHYGIDVIQLYKPHSLAICGHYFPP